MNHAKHFPSWKSVRAKGSKRARGLSVALGRILFITTGFNFSRSADAEGKSFFEGEIFTDIYTIYEKCLQHTSNILYSIKIIINNS